MRCVLTLFAGLFGAAALLPGATGTPAADPPAWAPKFKMQEIDTLLSIGYAVLVADINGDKKPDILVVDQLKVVWYENPTWKKHVILDGKTKPDNVCATVMDVDGDGKLDIVLGAGWRPSDTSNPGTLQWLKQPANVYDEWTLYPIPCDEPTVHRVRAVDLDGDGKPEIVMAPLQGRDATPKGNWLDGRPVRILKYKVPADPTKPENWKPEVLSEELHVVHNFDIVYQTGSDQKQVASILTASYEGVHALWIRDGKVERHNPIGKGNQDNPKSNRGSSEVRVGYLTKPDGGPTSFDVAIEPWHGHQVVVYPIGPAGQMEPRHVIDEHLRWGHAVQCADIDGEPGDEIVVGVRDDPNPKMGDTFTERRGVRIYKNTGGIDKWERFILEDGGVAVEDLAVADLDGDGRKDIIACGRQTKNVRIYWNQGK
ncbi:MAG TPA: VCBS repeat-containing protein [Gemmataceae bacterium]|nr:VCBS repeat-containing protein [Gemmataceae bacterium]